MVSGAGMTSSSTPSTRGQGLLEAGEPGPDRPRRFGIAHEGDPSVTQAGQVVGDEAAAGEIVDGDRQGVGALFGAVDQHHGGLTVRQRVGLLAHLVVVRDHDQSRDPAFGVLAQVALFALRVACAVGHQDGPGSLRGPLLHPAGDLHEAGVPGVEQHQPDRRGVAGPQVTCRLITDEPQLGDGGLDPGPSGGAYPLRMVQHMRDGAVRNPGVGGDIAAADPALGLDDWRSGIDTSQLCT